MTETMPKNLIGLDRQDLITEMAAIGEPKFRAEQLFHWIYHRGATHFAAMSNLSKPFRARLETLYTVQRLSILEEQVSSDGTRKWLLAGPDGAAFETVYIPEVDRGTLCVSSQVGCTLNCRFCHTGTQRLVRNLSVAEIIGQIMLARDAIGEWPTPTSAAEDHDRLISNIVMMGMGEPLYNFDNVAKALKIAMDHAGIAISKRKITLSTAGVVPMMARAGAEIGVNLAVSLHAVTDEVRDLLVPINRKYPLRELLAACRDYPGANNARRITFEYVMLDGINDSPADALELVRLLKNLPAKVNLIPFNPWPGAPYQCSSDAAIDRFAAVVMKAGYAAPIRKPRGRDILAACGQLKSASERLPARGRDARGPVLETVPFL